MSVDFYDCDVCGKNGVYEEYISYCHDCNNNICSDCVINTPKDLRGPYLTHLMHKEGGIDPKYCPFCSGNKVSAQQLIDYLLKVSGMSIKDALENIINSRKN